jgi:hypothetical protein
VRALFRRGSIVPFCRAQRQPERNSTAACASAQRNSSQGAQPRLACRYIFFQFNFSPMKDF